VTKEQHGFTLADGRTLHYFYYGVANEATSEAMPLLFFHGTPGTGRMAELAAEHAETFGFNLIAPDRSGLGGTDYQPHRKLWHYPQEIKELLSHLGIKKCGIVAISGGVPFALQAAKDLPEQIEFLAILSGWLSYGRPEAQAITIQPAMKALGWCCRYAKPLMTGIGAVLAYAITRHPDCLMKHLIADLSESDQQILAQPEIYSIIKEDLQRAFCQGAKGVIQEAALQFSKAGFLLSEVKQPIIMLHGTADTIAPHAFAEVMQQQLPNLRYFKTVEKGGHFCAIEEQRWIFEMIARLRGELS
jgi:pimeloyl-ACP methyl ester carboxylesterase